MKKLLFIFCIYLSVSVHGQSLQLLAKVEGKKVILRWFPMDYTTWKQGSLKGYWISRRTVVDHGRTLPPTPFYHLYASKIKPLAKIPNVLMDNNYVKAASELAARPIGSDKEENEMVYAMSMQVTSFEPAAADAMGLRFTDKHADPNSVYEYEVSIDSTLFSRVVVRPNRDTHFEVPSQPKVWYKDHTASLKWYDTDSLYQMAYYVERSDDLGRTFKRITKLPLLPVDKPDSTGRYYCSFADSLKVLYKYYTYRIQALNPFGPDKDYSAPTQIYAYFDRLPNPDLQGKNIPQGNVLVWTFPDSLAPHIKGYRIYRGSRLDTLGTLITGDSLYRVHQFLDKEPTPNAYYQVAAVDYGNHNHLSLPLLLQINDTIPPEAPHILRVDRLIDNRVLIRWAKNHEPDFYGYSVYKSNLRHGDFTVMTAEMVRDTFYLDTLSAKMLDKYVYYFVKSYDTHLNTAKGADTLTVRRPDSIPPSDPVFVDFKSTERSIYLKWVNSSSDDLWQTELIRYAGKDSVRLRLFTPADSLSDYLDSTALTGTTYRYELVAYDDSQQRNAGKCEIKMALFDPGYKAAVANFTAVYMPDKKQIQVQWSDPRPVSKYILYRKAPGGYLSEFKYFDPKITTFLELNPTSGNSYQYALMALFADKSNTRQTTPITVIVP